MCTPKKDLNGKHAGIHTMCNYYCESVLGMCCGLGLFFCSLIFRRNKLVSHKLVYIVVLANTLVYTHTSEPHTVPHTTEAG